MPPTVTAGSKEPGWKLAARAVGRVFYLSILFLGAGKTDWGRGWLLAGLIVGSIGLNYVLIARKNPSLVRSRLEKHDDVKPFDRRFFAVSVPLGFLFLLVSGLDERFGWSPAAPGWMWAGLLLHAAGTIPVALASYHNPFLELAVRIQSDRGQHPVNAGPYRYVRHPMYAGMLLMFAGWPLVTGTLWGYVPLGLLAAAYVVRTALEDGTLRRELDGYEEYARHTRYRLIPGVW